MAQSSKFHENCGCFLICTPHKTRTFTVRFCSNDQIPRKRFCSRGVAWTRPSKSRPNRSHSKRSYSISNIGNMMGCDHQSCVPVGLFAGELWHFAYFPTTTVHRKWLNSIQGFDLGGVARKKSITRTGLDRTGQDRTTKK